MRREVIGLLQTDKIPANPRYLGVFISEVRRTEQIHTQNLVLPSSAPQAITVILNLLLDPVVNGIK